MAVESIWRDLRCAWRSLRRAPAYSIAVIASLTLGIGLNTAVYSLVERVVLRPLPFHDDARLLAIGRRASDDVSRKPEWQMLPFDVEAWRAARSIGSMAAYSSNYSTVAGHGEPEYTAGASASENLPRVLGVQPRLGRWFDSTDAGANVVVLGERLWQRQFARDPAIIGQTLRMNGAPWTVVGVIAERTALPLDANYWTPFPPIMGVGGMIVVRPRDGVSRDVVARELTSLSPAVANAGRFGRRMEIIAVPLREQLYGPVRPTLLLVFGATTLLLFIACANVANLSLARAIERRRELAVRLTLGASRSSLAGLLLGEAAVLAVFAATLGFVLAAWSTRLVARLGPADIARLPGFEISGSTLLFALGCAAAAGVATSIAPIATALRGGTKAVAGHISSLLGAARASRGTRRVFVSAQLALALLLLTSTGLVIGAVVRLTRVDHLGFSPENVVIASLRLPYADYHDPARRQRFMSELRARVESMPGIRSMAFGPAPLVGGTGEGIREGFDAVYSRFDPNRPESSRTVWLKQVDPQYFETYRMRLRHGRLFTAADGAAAPRVAVLNATAARQFFGDEDPLGRVVFVPPSCSDSPVRAVGVVDDALQRDVSLTASPEVFIPLAQPCLDVVSPTVAVRSDAPPGAVIALMRQTLRDLDPQLAPVRLEAMTDILDASLARHRFLLVLLTVFAALGLVLAVTGVYGVMSYFVTQRHHEIGVRLALGAQRRNIVDLVLREGMILTIAGTGIGLAATFLAIRALASVLHGVDANEGTVLASTTTLLGVVALAAAYLPARRAMRMDPAASLRAE